MITSLRMVDFKNFADATLHLGPLTLVIGTNASGKSNIGDAFRFLSRIPSGRGVNEIIGGYRDWEPLRGAMNEIVRIAKNKFQIEIISNISNYFYKIDIEYDSISNIFNIKNETFSGFEFSRDLDIIYPKFILADLFRMEKMHHSNLLINSTDENFGFAKHVWIQINYMRVFDLESNDIKAPSLSGEIPLGDHGENTPTVLRRLHDNPETKTTLLSWLAEISPMDISDLEFGTNEAGYTYFSLIDGNGQKISARSASDGTLRYLAYLAAILDAKPGSTFFFEELDTGIHPTRLHLLLEFMEGQAKAKDLRIIVTTHSPLMLDLASDETFENSSLVYRGADGSGKIKRLNEFPNLKELRQTQGLGRLHASSWFEQAASYIDNPGDAS